MRFGAILRGHASALAAMAALALDFRAGKPIPDPGRGDVPLRKQFKKASRGRSKQKGSIDRLLLDRSSTVRKMQRYLNNGSLEARPPKTDRHLQRHAWYRRQKEKELRKAATEAYNAQ